MTVPTFFIVGAPRCGTTSLWAYLTSHPQVFMCNPKEPHHFGSLRPPPRLETLERAPPSEEAEKLGGRGREQSHADVRDRQKYLHLFDGAGNRLAGEASTHYLYSQSAPHEILAVSSEARIIIMLRDPVEMVRSVHAHGLFWGYEDLPDLEQALAAEEDRRQGRRIPRVCFSALALQYTFTAKYSEHVRRYLDIFGRERVKCVLFDDLRDHPDRTYRETLAFLGLEAASLPDFNAHNETRHWRSLRIARIAFVVMYWARYLWLKWPDDFRRKSVLWLPGLLLSLHARLNMTTGDPVHVSPELKARLRELFRDDVEQLAGLIERDLSSWLPPPKPRSAERRAKCMKEITGIGTEVAGILLSIDLADIGQRDFRNLWQSLESLSDQIRTLCPGSESPLGFCSWLRRIERVRRQVLEFLTAARLARGRSFGRARRALLKSAGNGTGTNVLHVPWAAVGDEQFREVLGTLQSIRKVCLKVQSYARPSTRD